MKITEVRGTITTTDGKTREFSIGTDGGWEQWGAVTADLGNTVDALEAMSRALNEDNLLVSDHDEQDDDHPEHDECADGCGLDVDHDGPCLDAPGGRVVCEHDDAADAAGT